MFKLSNDQSVQSNKEIPDKCYNSNLKGQSNIPNINQINIIEKRKK